ncbi:hypothetical protein HUG10_18170 [Halorarum halophilum]|uniref:Uncharacterized protein n=1 Tax=Halorarum halophilum TaxID=2743090 RepID=A0A7D5KVR6_9EURY|nr:hypothetical protein HUG10_18170 [Halobaculum halophilum]
MADRRRLGVDDADEADSHVADVDDDARFERVRVEPVEVRREVGSGRVARPVGRPLDSGVEVVVAERVRHRFDGVEERAGVAAARLGRERQRPERGGITGADDDGALVAERLDGARHPADVGRPVEQRLQVREVDQAGWRGHGGGNSVSRRKTTVRMLVEICSGRSARQLTRDLSRSSSTEYR